MYNGNHFTMYPYRHKELIMYPCLGADMTNSYMTYRYKITFEPQTILPKCTWKINKESL